ncbi:PREDICTED: uncharacterized protein LOC105555736 [Vollenhovia emeryi]|uniref:uncharacterized protein LOC105555736 n=1 Tax=Vollenhovia emeryi TaxID=411798 RepID=UPI0005F4D3BB|nr:PREDICTED: uncharacterized protein LOC105555736 [Vollenhovia emeryi]
MRISRKSHRTRQNSSFFCLTSWLHLCRSVSPSMFISSMCERCKTKLNIEEVKPIPIPEGKEIGMSVDMFYKKNNERNTMKLEKTERDGPTCKRPRAKGIPASKPKPIHKEPECLTISSDEEEEGRTKQSRKR